MISRALVASCVALCCAASWAQPAPGDRARIGVMPVAVPPRASDVQREQAERYTRELTEAIAQHRPDVITLGIPGDPAPSPSSQQERRTLARLEGRRMATGQLVSAWLQGSGRGERLGVELLDPSGTVLVSVHVRPQQEGSAWLASVSKHLRPHIAPEAPLSFEPAPSPSSAATSPAPSAPPSPGPPPVAAPPSPEVHDEEVGASSPAVTAVEVSSDDDMDALPWIVGSSGAAVVLGGVVALALGSVYGTLAWDESTRLVKLPGGDPERLAMEESSLHKAGMADMFFLVSAVLVFAGAATAGTAFFLTE